MFRIAPRLSEGSPSSRSGPTMLTTALLLPLIYLYIPLPLGIYTESLHLVVPLPLSGWIGNSNSVASHLALSASCANNPWVVIAYKIATPIALRATNNCVTLLSGVGNFASSYSVPTTVACHNWPSLDIPHNRSSQIAKNFVSLASVVHEVPFVEYEYPDPLES